MGSLEGYTKSGEGMPEILKILQRHNEEYNARIDRRCAATIWDWFLMALGHVLTKAGHKIGRRTRLT